MATFKVAVVQSMELTRDKVNDFVAVFVGEIASAAVKVTVYGALLNTVLMSLSLVDCSLICLPVESSCITGVKAGDSE